jgi:DNA-binding ferritin-like protein
MEPEVIIDTPPQVEGVNDDIVMFGNIEPTAAGEEDNVYTLSLADMAYVAFLWRNDLHWLHHHISGAQFDELHEVFGEYYEKAIEEFDFFSEKAIANGENIINLSRVNNTEIYNSWNPLEESANGDVWNFIDIKNANTMLIANGTEYIEALQLCRQNIEGKTDIESKIDEFLDYWTTEIHYKAIQRSKE